MRRLVGTIFIVFLTLSTALAADIEGVQPAALDQPRVYLHLRREIKGKPLAAAAAEKGAEHAINITAFLDTGASGVMLSRTTADALGVKRETAGGDKVLFKDVGVGGGDSFNVSEPLYVFVAPSRAKGEPDDADDYPLCFGPVRAQVGPLSSGLLDMLTGGLDVVGMPAIKGRVAVIDPKPVDTFGDTMRAGVFDRAAKGNGKNGIPKTDRHIKLTYASFKRFTSVEPAGAAWPTLADNPIIGPSPVASAPQAGRLNRPDTAPPIIASLNGKTSSGSWLLDTGAAASMISSAQAARLGVSYVAGTEGTNSPKLAGVPEANQFTFTIGGVGGAHKAAGFFLDKLIVPTSERDPLVYIKAPVLVSDITVADPQSKQQITLDGVFGMNFLVASAFITEAGLLPDIGKMTVGPFEWIVFDEPAGVLGVKLKK